jgi:Fanconi anemia group M protein
MPSSPAAGGSSESAYYAHELIKPEVIESRSYQTDLADAAVEASSLVVMPTGTGKTPVALMVMVERLKQYPRGRALMLAPTKPLVEQQAEFFRESLELPEGPDGVKVFTGETPPDKREAQWRDPTTRVVVATPQVIRNDIVAGRVSLEDVVYLIFDECHRASGDYPYTYVAEAYGQASEKPLVTGLSASPGSNKDDILQVCANLGLETAHIKSPEDPDMAEYIPETTVEYKLIDLPDELLEIRDLLQERYVEILTDMKQLGAGNSTSKTAGFRSLQKARAAAQEMKNEGNDDAFLIFSLHAEAVKLFHALKRIESQGAAAFLAYLDRAQKKANSGGSKADKRFVSHPKIQQAREMAAAFDQLHPKKDALRMFILEEVGLNEGQAIVFTESRVVVDDLVEFLSQFVNVHRFVGQGNKDGDPGMTQTEQQEVIDRFRDGEFDVLVATSVAEEGLDIPSVDLVVFYEPVGSAIQDIQRRGRTGRRMPGRVRILAGRGTRDEGAYWSARRGEKNMKSSLQSLKEQEDSVQAALEEKHGQSSLTDYDSEMDGDEEPEVAVDEPEPEPDTGEGEDAVEQPQFELAEEGRVHIYADTRELNSDVPARLRQMEDVNLSMETLPVGDFILSERVAVERKTWIDLLDTLTSGDRSLFEQLGDLRRNFEFPILLLEGDIDDLYSRNIHNNAIYGTLGSVILSFGVYPLFSRSEEESAAMLARLAHREQVKKEQSVNPHADKGSRSEAETQEYIVSSVAMNVGPKLAERLLDHFGSVAAVFSASEEELQVVEGVGEKTAQSFRAVLDAEYSGEN